MDSYALARGTLTATALNADDDAFLINWKALMFVADADDFSLDWNVATVNEVEYSADRVYNLDGRAKNLGDITISPWEIIVSSDMAVYLEATIFQGYPDAVVTLKTYDQYSKEWVVLNGIVERPRMVGNAFDAVNNMYLRRMKMEFRQCEVAST
jgi:hypothetical protein